MVETLCLTKKYYYYENDEELLPDSGADATFCR